MTNVYISDFFGRFSGPNNERVAETVRVITNVVRARPNICQFIVLSTCNKKYSIPSPTRQTPEYPEFQDNLRRNKSRGVTGGKVRTAPNTREQQLLLMRVMQQGHLSEDQQQSDQYDNAALFMRQQQQQHYGPSSDLRFDDYVSHHAHASNVSPVFQGQSTQQSSQNYSRSDDNRNIINNNISSSSGSNSKPTSAPPPPSVGSSSHTMDTNNPAAGRPPLSSAAGAPPPPPPPPANNRNNYDNGGQYDSDGSLPVVEIDLRS